MNNIPMTKHKCDLTQHSDSQNSFHENEFIQHSCHVFDEEENISQSFCQKNKFSVTGSNK